MPLFRALFPAVVLVLAIQAPAFAGAESPWTWLGPEGGALSPFVFSGQDPALIFGAGNNGVFRSRDGGASWVRLASGLGDPDVRALVATDRGLLAGTRRGLFLSADEGESWRRVDLGGGSEWVMALAADPRDPSRVLAGTVGPGIFRSQDGGESWTPANEGVEDPYVMAIAYSPIDSETVFAATAAVVYQSADGGRSWSDIHFNLTGFPAAIAVNPEGEPLVGTSESLFVLRDQVWINLFEADDALSEAVTSIALNPSNPREILVGTIRSLAISRDAGETWTRATVADLPNLEVRGLAYHPFAPRVVLVGASAGTFVSRDSGSSWMETARGLRASWVSQLGLDSGNPSVLYGAGYGGVHKTVTGKDWLPIRGQLEGLSADYFAQDPGNPNLLLAVQGNGLYRSRDAGLRWDLRSFSRSPLATNPSAPGLVFAGGPFGGGIGSFFERISRSRDFGETWENVTGNLPASPAAILSSRIDPNRVFVATRPGVYFSSMMGESWRPLNGGLTDPDVVALSEGRDGAIYARTLLRRVFRLDDPDGEWKEVASPSTKTVWALTASPRDGALYAATDGDGLLVSRDAGQSWAAVEGLENPYLRDVQLSPDGRRLYVAGSGGVYERVLEDVGDLGVSITQEVSGNPFPRGAVEFSIRLAKPPGPAGEGETVYRYRQDLPLGLRLLRTDADAGEIYAGPAYNSFTWIGELRNPVTLRVRAEVLDGAQDRELATQGVLVRRDDPFGPRSFSDDTSTPSVGDANVVATVPSPFRTGTLAVPRALPLDDTFVGVAFLHRAPMLARVEAEGIDADGAAVQTVELTPALAPSAQSTILTRDVLSSGQTVLIRSPDAGLEGFFLLGDDRLERLDGVGGRQMDSQRLHFGRVQENGGSRTWVFLFNPDSAVAARASLELFDGDGRPLGTSRLDLSPHGSIWAPVSQIFPDPPTLDGYIRVESDRPLRGFEWVVGQRTFETLPATPVESADRFWAPHAFFGGGAGTTRLRLLNTGPRDVEVTVRFVEDEGGLAGRPKVVLAAGQLRVLDLAELFSDGDRTRQGWLRVDAATVGSAVFEWPSLFAAVEFQSGDGSMASTLPLITRPTKTVGFLQVAQSSRSKIFQGLALLGAVPTPTFEFFNLGAVVAFRPDGFPSGFNLTAPGFESRVSGLLDDDRFFGRNFQQEGGRIEVFAEVPLAAYTIFGGPGFFSAVEAQGPPLFLY